MILLMIAAVCMSVLMPGWAWALMPVKNAQVVDSNGKALRASPTQSTPPDRNQTQHPRNHFSPRQTSSASSS